MHLTGKYFTPIPKIFPFPKIHPDDKINMIKKEDKKIAVNVLLEIKNQSAKSQAEKEYNEKCALLCKWLIDEFHQPK